MADPVSGHVPSRRFVWIVLAFGCLAGLSTYLVSPLEQSEQLMLATDVYRYATQSWLETGELYGVAPSGRPGYNFLYPPIAVVAFLPHALVGSAAAAWGLQTVLNAGAAIGTAFVVYRALDRRGVQVDRRDFALLCAFMLLSSYSAIQFLNGQINLWLALGIAIGFEAADRNRTDIAGVLFAVVALFKVFPAILGLWLLRMRAYRSVAIAIGTGVGGVVLGALVFGPDLTVTYLGDVLLGRFEGSTYSGAPSPDDNVDGIHRQLAAFWPGGGIYQTVIAAAVMGPLAALTLRSVDSTFRRDVAGLGIIVSILLFLPLQPLYFPLIVFPLCMLLYTLPPGRERYLLLGGTLLTLLHLDQESIMLGLDLVPVPEPLAGWLVDLSATVFTVILPPTLGLWLILFTCVLIQVSAHADRSVLAWRFRDDRVD